MTELKKEFNKPNPLYFSSYEYPIKDSFHSLYLTKNKNFKNFVLYIRISKKMVKEISTEIIINSTPEKLWEVITDFKGYSKWNPFIVNIEGEPKKGEKIELQLHLKSGKNRTYHPTITKVEKFKEIRWKGQMLSSLLFQGERVLSIEKVDDKSVKFINNEVFSGIASGFTPKKMDSDIEESFKMMNTALKNWAERDLK